MLSTAHLITAFFALATLANAVLAARYWFKSAAVPIPETPEPIASIEDVAVQHIETTVVNLIHVRVAMHQASRLNKLAAIWTGASAVLGALTSIAGLF